MGDIFKRTFERIVVAQAYVPNTPSSLRETYHTEFGSSDPVVAGGFSDAVRSGDITYEEALLETQSEFFDQNESSNI